MHDLLGRESSYQGKDVYLPRILKPWLEKQNQITSWSYQFFMFLRKIRNLQQSRCKRIMLWSFKILFLERTLVKDLAEFPKMMFGMLRWIKRLSIIVLIVHTVKHNSRAIIITTTTSWKKKWILTNSVIKRFSKWVTRKGRVLRNHHYFLVPIMAIFTLYSDTNSSRQGTSATIWR